MRWNVQWGVCCAVCLAMVTTAFAATPPLEVDYAFDRPVISQINIGGQLYDRVTMPGVSNGGNIGQPALPASGARILIPFGTEVSSIQVIPGEKISLGSDFLIEPVAQPVKLSDDPAAAPLPTPDGEIYTSPRPFPRSQFVEVGLQVFRGYQILILKLQPVQYVPASGELYYYSRLTVVVDTVDTGRKSSLFRGLERDNLAVAGRVDNPKMADSYPVTRTGGSRAFDLLILTTDSLSISFQSLKNYHDARGVATQIHTTTDVGSSDPDDIRDYIRDRYQYDGIEYVLIGADDDIIPAKDLYVLAYAGGDTEYNMPGDIYYACLDGTWNYDSDSYWGEPTDGEGGGDVDMVAEVYVGRASVGNSTEAGRFVTKTIWYLDGSHTHPEKVLLVGEYLGFGGESEYAANTLEELIDGCSTHGYTTVGIPSADYTIDELFERDMSWYQSDLTSRINAGLHFLNHLGHGSEDYAMKMYNSDITSDLTNDDLCFVYSQTCLAGHFDGTDCWAETMNIKTDNGGFAVIMNARSGWGDYDTTDGPSQRFNREFWDAIFDEGMPELSKANQDSKEDNIYRINEGCMRWCTYGLNLFGDPTVGVSGLEIALKIRLPNGLPGLLTPGQATDITVEIDPGDENYIPGSGTLHYRYDGGTYQTSPLVHQSGDLYTATLPAAYCDDIPEYYFGAQGDVNGTVYSPAAAPTSVYTVDVGEWLTIVDDDFETDQGWTTSDDGNATSGFWQRGVPVDDPSWNYAPASDSDGSGQCWLTENDNNPSYPDPWNTDVDNGAVTLTSSTIDMSDGNITISYDYYLNLTRPEDDNDVLLVEIDSNDGAGPWTQIARHNTNGGRSWRSHTIEQSDLDTAGVSLTSTMKLRFTANDADTQSINESGLDALLITSLSCTMEPYAEGDLNCDGSVNSLDIDPFVLAMTSAPDFTDYYASYPDCDAMLADCNSDGSVNSLDVDPFVGLLN